ncbi:MAG: UDP-glucose 4-epimerase GalE [Acidobacteria bacterium]|nr:UDP-glucose 4-epimerase GalE [Acidobacteriota bacterium]
MAVLVTGGAGYIGSVTVEMLREQGKQAIVLDNLVYGHKQALFEGTPFYEGHIGDAELVKHIVLEHDIKACIHFAAFAYVGESVEKPSLYYENNVAQGIRLLDALVASNVKQIVFSSTCATYGEPQRSPLDENHPQQPTNPYGASKLFMERIMKDYDQAYGLRFVALRYFNAAGATPTCGEDHAPETHLIPLVLLVAQGKRSNISVFGKDYPTHDGTCVRDYIHVTDLASAHLAALGYLERGGASMAFNLGNGQGYSVLDVIETAREVTGRKIEVRVEARRAGDPSHLVADATRAREILGWQPRYPSLKEIIGTAWKWQEAHPDGYRES